MTCKIWSWYSPFILGLRNVTGIYAEPISLTDTSLSVPHTWAGKGRAGKSECLHARRPLTMAAGIMETGTLAQNNNNVSIIIKLRLKPARDRLISIRQISTTFSFSSEAGILEEWYMKGAGALTTLVQVLALPLTDFVASHLLGGFSCSASSLLPGIAFCLPAGQCTSTFRHTGLLPLHKALLGLPPP